MIVDFLFLGILIPEGDFMISLLNSTECLRTIFAKSSTLCKSRFKKSYFTRAKKMPFQKLLHFLMLNRKTSVQAALDAYFQKEGDETHMSQQALSKARNHFDHSPFEKAFFALRDEDYNLASDCSLKRFHRFKIFAVDGSMLALPNIQSLQEELVLQVQVLPHLLHE